MCQVLHLKGPSLPDFDHEQLSTTEQEHYLDSLLASQLSLARSVCSDSPFSALLHKRLTVLQRIYYAISTKFHDREKNRQLQHQEDGSGGLEEGKAAGDRGHTATEALIEMGVRTGLSLIFSLLRQNWTLSLQGGGNINLCNDVLQTALEVTCSLPPLSLANESKLPALGLSSLSQVTQFLKSVSLPQSGADVLGRRLACELVLALSAQRGSLRYLLEWVEMALCASVACRHEETVSGGEAAGAITYHIFCDVLKQMKKSAVSHKCFFSFIREP